MKKRRIVIVTWVSWSWKTTLKNELLSTWERITPTNCTTREPRWDWELDEYVFISKERFDLLSENKYFLENTNYWWNLYWILNSFLESNSEKNVIIVLDPIWRAIASEYFIRNWIEFETYFLEISPEEQQKRLITRGDSREELLKRQKDFLWFSPTPQCKILSGNNSTECLVKLINN